MCERYRSLSNVILTLVNIVELGRADVIDEVDELPQEQILIPLFTILL